MLIVDVLTSDVSGTRIKREVLEDEEKDMYATEYKKAFTSIVSPPEVQPPVKDKRITRRTTRSRSRSRPRAKSKEKILEEETKTEEVPIKDKTTVKKHSTVTTKKKTSTAKKELSKDINEEQKKTIKPNKTNKNTKTTIEKRVIDNSPQNHAKTVTKVKETTIKTITKKEPGSKKKVTWARQFSDEKPKPSKTIITTTKPEPKPLSKSIPV